jgi:hypothetical protein
MAITSPNLTPGVLVIGAKYRQWSNPQELTTQPNKQTFPTPVVISLCTSVGGKVGPTVGPSTKFRSGQYVCASDEPDIGAVRTPSPAHQNHVSSIPFLWEKQFITRLHNIVHKQWTYSNAYIHFKGKEGWTMPQLQDIVD